MSEDRAIKHVGEIPEDREFEETVIAKVRQCEDGDWTIERSDGGCFFVPRDSPVTPIAGQLARFYGRGFGYPVRGLALEGRIVFYRSPEQHEADMKKKAGDYDAKLRSDFEKNRAKLDADYDALPDVFKRRIDKFRRNNPDFRWKFESYEMFCCMQAVLIADAFSSVLQKHKGRAGAMKHVRDRSVSEDIAAWASLSFEEQKKAVPGLSDGHSGNTFGCAVRLARLYIEFPEGVVQQYGALAPLVGSEEYGCVPKGEAVTA